MSRLDYKWRALIVVIVGTFMVILDTTIVNIALPRIMSTFNVTVDKSQLVLTMYLLALALVIPATGFLSDRLGTKRVYTFVLAGFTLGSALCGLAWSLESLVAFRIFQGLVGGMTMPLGMTIIYRTVPRQEQGYVMGLFGVPLLLAPVIGPTLGGYLVEYVDWRMVFYINVPVGILGFILTTLLLRETEKVKTLAFDYKGFILSGVGFSAALLALTRAPDDGWGSATVIALFSAAVIALVAWVVVELREPSPLLDLRIFRDLTFTMGTAVNFIVTVGVFSAIFLLPVFLQNVRGLGALESGLLLLPQALAAGVAMPLSGRLYDKLGPRPPIIVGLAILSYATFRLYNLDISTSDATLSELLVLRGLGMGLAAMPAMTAAMGAVPFAQVSRASALTNVLRQLFAAFGTAVFATFVATRQDFHFNAAAQTLTPSSVYAMQAISTIERMAMQHGAPLVAAKQLALQSLAGFVHLRAAIAAFDDAFLVAGVVILVGIVPALFLRKPQAERPSGTAPTPSGMD